MVENILFINIDCTKDLFTPEMDIRKNYSCKIKTFPPRNSSS